MDLIIYIYYLTLVISFIERFLVDSSAVLTYNIYLSNLISYNKSIHLLKILYLKSLILI
jgi:hypothetical protein